MKRFTGKSKLTGGKPTGFSNRMQDALYSISKKQKGKPISTGYFNPQDGTVGINYYYDTTSFFNGSAITDYTLNGTLPTGLVLDGTTGIISGSPTTIQTLSDISITGTNNSGSDETNVADITIT